MKAYSCEEFRAELEREHAPLAHARSSAWNEHLLSCADCRGLEEVERWLAIAPAPAVPSDLARRVLDALAPARREARLDALLEALPAPEVPDGLAARILARLEPERAARRRRMPARGLVLVAAGLALALALALRTWHGRRAAVVEPEIALAAREDEELWLYALERWELLTSADLDLLLASLDPEEEVLIEFAAPELEEPAPAAPQEESHTPPPAGGPMEKG